MKGNLDEPSPRMSPGDKLSKNKISVPRVEISKQLLLCSSSTSSSSSRGTDAVCM